VRYFRSSSGGFDAAMRAALGDDFLLGVSSDRRARLRSARGIYSDLFVGIDDW
jgi:hypothetical protein